MNRLSIMFGLPFEKCYNYIWLRDFVHERGKKMPIIYEPKGKAREYAELAANLYTGCLHACKYCYCPAIRRTSLEKWAANPYPRKDILKQFRRDAKKASDEMKQKELLFSFMSDPFQDEFSAQLTKQALEVCDEYSWQKVNVLTKNGQLALETCGDLLWRKNWKLSQTVSFLSEAMREEWEPGAPSIESRIDAFAQAKAYGIFTWVSIEPVINPVESLSVMKKLKGIVDGFKVGKLNHNKVLESKIDWREFLTTAQKILAGENVYWKKDLLNAAKTS